MPNIFDYLDYREYLREVYDESKAIDPKFSYRYFARKAGFSSPNFLKLVIEGRRNLGRESVQKIAASLELEVEEWRFFTDLVDFNQAETTEERDDAFERVAASRRFRSARQLESGLLEYTSMWYYPAIREMVARADFVEHSAWIADDLFPPITAQEVEDAIEVLLRLKLLERDGNGRLVRGKASLKTGHEASNLALGKYHRQMMRLAGDSIEALPSDRRDISGLTVCISDETAQLLKDRIHTFRELLLDISDRDEKPEVVYQVNIQLFPLSAKKKK